MKKTKDAGKIDNKKYFLNGSKVWRSFKKLKGNELFEKMSASQREKVWRKLGDKELSKESFCLLFSGRYSFEISRYGKTFQINNLDGEFIFASKSLNKFSQRSHEVRYLRRLMINSDVLLTGPKGVGKTTVANLGANKYVVTEIDVVKLNKNKLLTSELFWDVNPTLKWRIVKNNFWQIFNKFFLPFIISAYSIITPILSTIDIPQLSSIIIWTSPLFPLVWFIYRFLASILFSVCHFRKKQLILVTELNYLEEEKYTELIWMIWKQFSGYKFIFENTNEIGSHIESKFALQEMNITSNRLINSQFAEFNSRMKNIEKSQRKIWDSQFKSVGSSVKIYKMLSMLTYREIDNILCDFKINFEEYKGELDFEDFLIIRFIKIKNTDLYNFYKTYYTYLTSSEFSIARVMNNKMAPREIRDKYIKNLNLLENTPDIVLNRDFFNLTKSTNTELMPANKLDNKIYTMNYFNTGIYQYLVNDMHEMFRIDPVGFIESSKRRNLNYFSLNLGLIDDADVMAFFKKLDSLTDDQKYSILDGGSFLFDASIDRLIGALIKSRGDKKNKLAFISKLPTTWLNSCVKWLFELDNFSEAEVKKAIEKNNLFIGARRFHELKGSFDISFGIRGYSNEITLIDYQKFKLFAIKNDFLVSQKLFLGGSSGTDGEKRWWTLNKMKGIKWEELHKVASKLNEKKQIPIRIFGTGINKDGALIKFNDFVNITNIRQIKDFEIKDAEQ